MNTWINIIAYQCVWTIAVCSASRGHGWPAWPAFVLFASWQLTRADGGRPDLLLMPVVAVAGACMDSLMAGSGLIAYADPIPSAHLAPLWIMAIWLSFALTLRHTFRFLHGRPWLAALLGGVGGPLAYWSAGRGWGTVEFPRGALWALLVLALMWAVALPAMLALAQYLHTRTRDSHPEGNAHA